MAAQSVCAIDGCNKPARNRGWCSAHYERYRLHGDPNRGGPIGTSAKEPLRYYRDVVLKYEGDECLIWPYGTARGYGVLHLDGRKQTVSRLVCEDVNGPAPSDRHHAAHECGQGRMGCVNPRHMSWKTPVENHADKLVHGTHNRGEKYGLVKLTEQDVREIRILEKTHRHPALATMFNVSKQTISDVARRRSWAWLD